MNRFLQRVQMQRDHEMEKAIIAMTPLEATAASRKVWIEKPPEKFCDAPVARKGNQGIRIPEKVKAEILNIFDASNKAPGMSLALSRQFGVSKSFISTLLKNTGRKP